MIRILLAATLLILVLFFTSKVEANVVQGPEATEIFQSAMRGELAVGSDNTTVWLGDNGEDFAVATVKVINVDQVKRLYEMLDFVYAHEQFGEVGSIRIDQFDFDESTHTTALRIQVGAESFRKLKTMVMAIEGLIDLMKGSGSI